MADIVQEGAPVLRQKAKPVPPELFGTPRLRKMIADMASALEGELDGVALAAPQIALPYRIFIVRYDRIEPPDDQERKAGEKKEPRVGVYINPKIIKTSRRCEEMDEGCLSVRGIYGQTRRHKRATIHAYDEDGHPFTRGAGGILAQVFQHETDHLNGVLFTDHAANLYEVQLEGERENHGEFSH